MSEPILRRSFLARGAAALSALALAGCTGIAESPWAVNLIEEVENLTRWAQRLFVGSHALAPEFDKADIAPVFRANGTLNPGTNDYAIHTANGCNTRIHPIEGQVEKPLKFS